MILTHSIIHSAGTSGIGFNQKQLALLGVKWPPRKGWLSRLIGTEIDGEVWQRVMDLKGTKRKNQIERMNESNYQKHLTQVKGWSDGAGRRPMSSMITDDLDVIYNMAYTEGQKPFANSPKNQPIILE